MDLARLVPRTGDGEASVTEYRSGTRLGRPPLASRRPLILGGVFIPCEYGLEGHSDADVLAHAITDAILGAAALGDIGMHFPDTDPQMERCRQPAIPARMPATWHCKRATKIVNVDSTVILERPKLKDYRQAIARAWRRRWS